MADAFSVGSAKTTQKPRYENTSETVRLCRTVVLPSASQDNMKKYQSLRQLLFLDIFLDYQD
jgi:hypothetical protein